MMKSKCGHTFRRSGENVRIAGFSLNDSYQEFVTRAGKILYQNTTDFGKTSIIVSQARLPNMPLEGKEKWTLGGYLRESGTILHKNRLVFGIYQPKQEADSASDVSNIHVDVQGTVMIMYT